MSPWLLQRGRDGDRSGAERQVHLEAVAAPDVTEPGPALTARLSATAARRAVLAAAAVAVVAIPALTLRLVDLRTLGFNSDEAVYAGQAAAIVGDPSLAPLFPVFRAHPWCSSC